MKTSPLLATLLLACGLAAHAATPAQENAFLDSYKKAFESNDTKALAAFLHTEGASKDTIEMFTMMQSMNAGKKVASIELITPSAADMEKFNKPRPMPDGKMYVMPFAPTKQLVVVVEEGGGKSTSKSPVGEKNGKLVIPVPVPAK